MKKHKHALLTFATAALLIQGVGLQGANAHPEEHHYDAHHHEDAPSHTKGDPLESVRAAAAEISKQVAEKNLDGIHDLSETLAAAAKKIAEDATGPSKARVVGSAKNLWTIAQNIHEAADAKDQASAEANEKKLVAMVKLLEQQMKAEGGAAHESHPVGEKCTDPDLTVTLTSKQYEFQPKVIEAKQGQKVCLRLKSEDVEHGVMIDDYHVHVHGSKESPGEVQFTASKKGEFQFVCHQLCGEGHGKMVGKLVVR